MVIRGAVFDLDDTLYFERDYVLSGFEHVARFASTSDTRSATLSTWLWSAHEAGIRGDTFDRMLAAFPDVAARHSKRELVAAYRAHAPSIGLSDGTREVLDGLVALGLRLGVLTDGPVESQSAKAAALGLDRWFDPVVLTAALGPTAHKPATSGFALIAATWSLPPGALVYVGDNPAKDFAGPRALGWWTIRLRDPRQERSALEAETAADAPDDEIAALAQLTSLLG
jgi:putative hydrolase of the HAD superfamily